MSDAARLDLSVGWIGAGVMGASMAGHLLTAGAALTVHTRSRARAEPLLARGAAWAERPADVAAACDVVFTMLGYPSDVRAVYLAPDGLVAHARPGALLVDCTTSEPALAAEIASAAEARGLQTLDAPVSGGDVGARNATLSVMVGGSPSALERARPLFAQMARTVVHQGGPGAGQHTKMVNQILIAGNMIGVCEALLYAQRAGLDAETVLQSVRPGAAGSWSLDNLAPRILRGDLGPGFYVEHFVKDLGIALAEARRMRLALPGLALAEQLYVALMAQGGARLGTQALYKALDRLNGA